MTAEQIIQSCRDIAKQHCPDNDKERLERQVELLETKVRELRHRPILDLPVFDPAKGLK